jgi:ATP-dependent RNA helicase RhlE
MHFQDLKLIDPLLRAVAAEGYTEPSPIQAQAIPYVLQGRDLLGVAQTGTGKTAAFALPILQYLVQKPRTGNIPYIRVLVLSPTRELAAQIGESFLTYGKNTNIRQATIFGGVNQNPQVQKIQRGVDVLVATPGRLLDLMQQKLVRLDRIEVLVLDEADRMLDMGFIHDVRRIISTLPVHRQTLLFSATMPGDIQRLAQDILRDPVRVEVTPAATTVEAIEQSIYFVEKSDKPALLQSLLRDPAIKRVLVFTRTKHGANKVVRQLDQARIEAEAIHGNKSQSARERALANFKSGTTRVLVATDIAARGLDVENISHVINYDLPNEPESYVHRIGRTGRAGAAGIALSFCDSEERAYLVDIERLIRLHIPRATNYPFASKLGPPPMTDLNPRGGRPSSVPSQRTGQSQNRPRTDNRSSSAPHRDSDYTRDASQGSRPSSGQQARRRRRRPQRSGVTTPQR